MHRRAIPPRQSRNTAIVRRTVFPLILITIGFTLALLSIDLSSDVPEFSISNKKVGGEAKSTWRSKVRFYYGRATEKLI
jgi:hypothetical protein